METVKPAGKLKPNFGVSTNKTLRCNIMMKRSDLFHEMIPLRYDKLEGGGGGGGGDDSMLTSWICIIQL